MDLFFSFFTLRYTHYLIVPLEGNLVPKIIMAAGILEYFLRFKKKKLENKMFFNFISFFYFYFFFTYVALIM